MFQSETPGLVRRGDRVQWVAHGSVLVDGCVCGDRIEARLTPESGLASDVVLRGAEGNGRLNLIGRGILRIGTFTLRDATATLDETGLSVTGSVDWADEPAAARFEMNSSGTWHARFDGHENLSCLMTGVEVLRTSITLELSPQGEPASSSALAVLDGRNIEVPPSDHAPLLSTGSLSSARLAILTTAAALLREELRTIAEQYAAAIADGHGDGRESGHHSPMAWSRAEPLTHATREALPAGAGYLRPHRAGVDSGMAAGGQRGFSAPETPASPAGYLVDAPRPADRTRGRAAASLHPVASHPGYLPAVSPDRGSGAERQALGPVRVVTPPREGHDPAVGPSPASIEVERLGYALLRCKDLLASVESAAAHPLRGG